MKWSNGIWFITSHSFFLFTGEDYNYHIFVHSWKEPLMTVHAMWKRLTASTTWRCIPASTVSCTKISLDTGRLEILWMCLIHDGLNHCTLGGSSQGYWLTTTKGGVIPPGCRWAHDQMSAHHFCKLWCYHLAIEIAHSFYTSTCSLYPSQGQNSNMTDV